MSTFRKDHSEIMPQSSRKRRRETARFKREAAVKKDPAECASGGLMPHIF